MIRKLIIGAGIVAVVSYFATVAYIFNADGKRSAELITNHKAAPNNEQVINVLYEKGCDYCHTTKAAMPFYAKWPIAQQLMEHDVERGYIHYTLNPVMNSLAKGIAPPEADLAKIERAIQDGTMPPMRYIALHWSGNMSQQERAILLNWIQESRQKYYTSVDIRPDFKNEIVQPLPEKIPTDALKVALGLKLYHDTRLSGDNTLSCASCHGLDTGGVDNLVTSKGINGQYGSINAPTVFNSVFNVQQFWDGRANDLQEQADGPPLNPIEMGSTSWEEIIAKLAADPELTREFLSIYPHGYSGDNITDAIAEFEKTLLTPNSPFDRYLKGDDSAITAQQLRGYNLFKEYKCNTCHVGKNLGGQSYELMGLKSDYFLARGNVTEADIGRFGVTEFTRDRFRFKTPTLRDIELTAPYLHDGSAADLPAVVKIMMEYQVGETLKPSELDDIVEFLKSLTGIYTPAV